jgi:hypothetical protein
MLVAGGGQTGSGLRGSDGLSEDHGLPGHLLRPGRRRSQPHGARAPRTAHFVRLVGGGRVARRRRRTHAV